MYAYQKKIVSSDDYFIFAALKPLYAQSRVTRTSKGELLATHVIFPVLTCDCHVKHPLLHNTPGLFISKKMVGRPFETPYYMWLKAVPSWTRNQMEFQLSHHVPLIELFSCLPIVRQTISIKVIDYNPSMNFSREMCLWSNKPLDVSTIVLCHDQKFVAWTSVVSKICDSLEDGQYFLTDKSVELPDKLSSFFSSTNMQYFAHCDFLDAFDLSTIRFVEKKEFGEKPRYLQDLV